MQITIQGMLERDGTELRWMIVRVPFSPAEQWPERVGLRVRGTITATGPQQGGPAFPFRTSLFGSAEGGHILLVNKAMQKGARVTAGSLVEIMLEPDFEERSAEPPPELAKLLKQDRALKKWFEQLSYSYRKDMADTISEPKSPEARVRRAEQLVERMMLAMEGERELPPILQVAFRKQPLARAGWEAMTANQRRGHLMGIFGYQSVESRARRADKAIAEAVRIATR